MTPKMIMTCPSARRAALETGGTRFEACSHRSSTPHRAGPTGGPAPGRRVRTAPTARRRTDRRANVRVAWLWPNSVMRRRPAGRRAPGALNSQVPESTAQPTRFGPSTRPPRLHGKWDRTTTARTTTGSRRTTCFSEVNCSTQRQLLSTVDADVGGSLHACHAHRPGQLRPRLRQRVPMTMRRSFDQGGAPRCIELTPGRGEAFDMVERPHWRRMLSSVNFLCNAGSGRGKGPWSGQVQSIDKSASFPDTTTGSRADNQ
jgi:hypothetical protein